MNRLWAPFALFFLFVASAFAEAPPKALVIQNLVPPDEQVNPNVLVRGYFIQEMEEDGRVQPIAYAMTDKTFREAVESGKVSKYEDSPSLETATKTANALGCEYTCIIQALKHQGKVYSSMTLYKGSRTVWSDRVELTAQVGDQFSLENTARSVARTWMLKMGEGPLKNFTRQPISRTPDPEAGTQPQTPAEPTITIPKEADNAAIRAEVAKLVKAGDLAEAIRVVRVAIDDEPMNLERRIMLVDLLFRLGRVAEARSESARAALLFPDAVELRLVAARAALYSGQLEDAMRHLNEALARKQDSPEVRSLMGQATFRMGRHTHSLEHFQAALKMKDSADGYLMLAINEVALGQPANFAKAQEGWEALSSESKAEAGRFEVEAIRSLATSVAESLRTTLQIIRRDPKSANGKAALDSCARTVGICDTIAKSTEFVAANPQFLERAMLAVRSLDQAVSEAKGHLANPKEDLVNDATLTLGDAMRALQGLAELMQQTP